MSICRGGFVENAWRKDLCSNCFRTREEHGEEMISAGFYQQPWAQAHPPSSPSSVNIQVKSPSPPLTIQSTYGLPPPPVTGVPTGITTRSLSTTSRYQSPSVGSGINHIGSTTTTTTGQNLIPVRTTGNVTTGSVSNLASSRYATAAIGSRINALYSDRVSPARTTTSSNNGGINVTVNGTSNSNIKKYVQQHPPQAAVRTSIPLSSGSGRVHTNNLPGGGVSVSVGRGSSYGNGMNTVGTGGTTTTVRTGTGNNNSGSNYGNPNNGIPPPTIHHHHQQRRTAHPQQPPTHHHHPIHPQHLQSNKTSSVPILTQSRNNLQTSSNNHGQGLQFTPNKLTSSSPVISVQQPTKETRRMVMDTPDGEVTTTSTVKMTMNCGHGGTSGFSSLAAVASPPMKTAKGILRKDEQKRKMSVTFPQEVCAVIGFGGENDSSGDESEEEVPSDPLDSSSIPEIMEKSATSPLEKELNRVTLKNTNFNSVKTNLLGYAPIEIGPITGGTGGKSKPLVSIGTFDSRKEPLRVISKVGDDPISSSTSKNVKAPITKPVTNSGKVKLLASSSSPVTSAPPPAAINRETEKPKTNNHIIQQAIVGELRRNGMTMSGGQQPMGSTDNRHPVHQKGRGNEPLSLPPQSHFLIGDKQNAQQRSQSTLESGKVPTLSIVPTTLLSKDSTSSGEGNLVIKRSSFLRDIISEALPSLSASSYGPASDNENIAETERHSLPHDSLEPIPPRVIKSELKLELATPFNSKQVYEVDSLECDSGLDTKTTGQAQTSETSESDTEKSGSNSDSGNENDFILEKLSRSSGLFVSIDQDSDETTNVHHGGKKTAKLSPDSVISSEMSSTSPTDSSGSTESLPQTIREEEEQLTLTAPPNIPKHNAPSIPPVLKRAAPLPPTSPFSASQPLPLRPYSGEEDLYDDVHLSSAQRNDENDNGGHEEAEESIYDDCTTVGNGIGSYDFMDSGNMDPDGEGVPLKQHPGIEFLGIRRIDSESFLKQPSPPPQSPPASKSVKPKKEQRSGSESPKPKRRVNQFFSTIGKKAGAAFRSTGQGQGTSLDFVTPTKTNSMKGPSHSFSPYKRSMSQDEVSMTRTQELYATLTPTSTKLRGLTPVLNKLSKLDLREPKEESPEKKKLNKFSTSIRKFLGFGVSLPAKDELEVARNSPPRQDVNSKPPPPPPPRVHSLDTLTKSGGMSLKPARPPPPRVNQVAPSFVSVFSGLEDGQGLEESEHPFHNPPNKPRRKASMCRGSDGGENSGAYTANYLETTYNHITSLNFETLKLIASQTPAKIKRASNQLLKMSKNPLRWSQFYVTDVESLASGQGYAFFSAFWEDEPCILLLQESLTCGLAPLEFDCIEMSASFEDVVQPQFIPWEPSDFVNTGSGIRVYISVLASCTVQKLPAYVNNGSISPSRKFYALLQAMDFWGKEEMSQLVVFHKIPTPAETVEEPSSTPNKSKSSPSPNFGLVYVVPTRIRTGSNNLLTYHPARDVFEGQMQGLLFKTTAPLLVENDKEILFRRLDGSTTEEVEAQVRLFLQLKLFGPRSGDLDKILRYRSERQVTQWMDKERAFCMNDALKRSLERNSEPMSPLRKSFVEFLMISDNCAKTILDFIVDLYPDI